MLLHMGQAQKKGLNNAAKMKDVKKNPKLFWPIVRKNSSNYKEKLLKFETDGREFANFLRSLEQFIKTVKGQNNPW